MRATKAIMGMPVCVEIMEERATELDIASVFSYLESVDGRFSTYKATSEISRVNEGLAREYWSDEMVEVMELSDETRRQTNGYFNIACSGQIDPSGLVKGWALRNAANILKDRGFFDYYVEAGGDIQVSRDPDTSDPWRVGIRNPFNIDQIVKVLGVRTEGVATSGTYLRGQHVYNPKAPDAPILDVVSITVVGPTILEADRFATAALAMGSTGIQFIQQQAGLEGYMISSNGIATFTDGFSAYVLS